MIQIALTEALEKLQAGDAVKSIKALYDKIDEYGYSKYSTEKFKKTADEALKTICGSSEIGEETKKECEGVNK